MPTGLGASGECPGSTQRWNWFHPNAVPACDLYSDRPPSVFKVSLLEPGAWTRYLQRLLAALTIPWPSLVRVSIVFCLLIWKHIVSIKKKIKIKIYAVKVKKYLISTYLLHLLNQFYYFLSALSTLWSGVAYSNNLP